MPPPTPAISSTATSMTRATRECIRGTEYHRLSWGPPSGGPLSVRGEVRLEPPSDDRETIGEDQHPDDHQQRSGDELDLVIVAANARQCAEELINRQRGGEEGYA